MAAESAVVDGHGNNALHLAAREGRPAIVKRLLEDGIIDVNALNNGHETALFIAVKGCSIYLHQRNIGDYMESVQLLLNARGIHPEIANSEGNTIIHAAVLEYDSGILDLLLKDGRVDPTARNHEYLAPIHIALLSGSRTDAVDILLKDRRVDPTAEFTNYEGKWSPLKYAAAHGDKPIALRLLEETRVMETITPEIRDWLGLTPENIEEIIKDSAWKRRRHATTAFAKYWESRAAEGGKRTRRNKRRVGRRVNTVGGRRTRRNKRCVGR